MLKDRHYLITGASSGIGLAVAENLLARGSRLTAIGRSMPEQATKVSSRYRFIQCDLAEIDQLDAVLDKAIQNEPFNGLIHTAGYGDFGSIEEMSVNRITRLINVNLVSLLLICRRIIPVLKKQSSGDVVFIGSDAGLQGAKRGSLYCASKFAVRGLAQSLRQECATSGVRVTLVNPGMVATRFYQQLDFTHGDEEENYIRANDLAVMIIGLLELPNGTVVDEINLSPLKKVIQRH